MVFRANSLGDVQGLLKAMVSFPGFRDPAGMEMVPVEWTLLGISLLVLLAVDLFHARGISLRKKLLSLATPVRVFLYAAGIGVILVFGVYGAAYDTSQFFYFQF